MLDQIEENGTAVVLTFLLNVGVFGFLWSNLLNSILIFLPLMALTLLGFLIWLVRRLFDRSSKPRVILTTAAVNLALLLLQGMVQFPLKILIATASINSTVAGLANGTVHFKPEDSPCYLDGRCLRGSPVFVVGKSPSEMEYVSILPGYASGLDPGWALSRTHVYEGWPTMPPGWWKGAPRRSKSYVLGGGWTLFYIDG